MLNDYRNKITSQNGEDGVIEEIIKRLEIEPAWCCEFGAWDGVHLSNTFNLVKTKKTKVVMIEGCVKKFPKLLSTRDKFPEQIIALNYFVNHLANTENSLDNILAKTEIPLDFDILSIDIDSYDLEVWENFVNYKPKLVIIEINNELPPGILQRHSEVNWLNSFTSTVDVARVKGYTLICHLFNLFFIRNDLLEKIRLEENYIKDPSLLFNWKWVKRLEWSKQKQERRLAKEQKRMDK